MFKKIVTAILAVGMLVGFSIVAHGEVGIDPPVQSVKPIDPEIVAHVVSELGIEIDKNTMIPKVIYKSRPDLFRLFMISTERQRADIRVVYGNGVYYAFLEEVREQITGLTLLDIPEYIFIADDQGECATEGSIAHELTHALLFRLPAGGVDYMEEEYKATAIGMSYTDVCKNKSN